MDLAPHLCTVRVTKRPLLFLIQGMLLAAFMVSAVSTILAISLVSHVDFPVVLLCLRGPLAMRLKKSSPGFISLNACVSDCEQIGHHLELLHGDLLHNLDVVESVMEGIDDLDVLDILDSVLSVVETFHIVPEALNMLLLDGRQSLNNRQMLVRALKVPDEHGT
jgi:hypothetical protein